MTETRFYATRSIANPDDDFHAAMGWVDFPPRDTFEQQRVRLVNHVVRDALGSGSDEVRERSLELARQLSEVEEPAAHGEFVLPEAGGVRYTIRRQG